MTRLRAALPALLVMCLIAGAGYLFAVGVRELLPEDLFETSPFDGLSAEEVELDPATGLPVVPLPASDDVPIWGPTQPNSRIDPANHWNSGQPAGTTDTERPSVSLVATFPSYEDALAAGDGLSRTVGDPLAEAAWLAAAGVEPGGGFEWLGPGGSETPFVQVVDRRLLVDGLAWHEDHEPAASDELGESGDDASYSAPLALALEALAPSLLVEGDRGGDGAIAFDLVCIGDEEKLLTLEQDLADVVYAETTRPPWIGPPLTLDERRARRTERLVTQLWNTAFVQNVMRSGELSDLGPLSEALDADAAAATMARLAAPPESPGPDESPAAEEAPPAGSAVYEVRADGRRLWVTLGTWFGIAEGYGPFVRYLDANGCDDIRIAFHDLGDVSPA